MGDVGKALGDVGKSLTGGLIGGGMGATIGGLFGGDDDYDEPASSKAAAAIAQQMFKESTPIREPLFADLTDFLGGGFDIGESPMWSPGKAAIEDQYQIARENILANLPVGGQLNEQLANLDIGRASSLTDLIGQIQQDMYNKAYGVATQTPQTSIAGLLGSGNIATQAQHAQMAADAGKDQLLGDAAMAAAMLLL